MIRTVVCSLSLAALAAFPALAAEAPARPGDRTVGPAFATRSPVFAQNGAAATAHPLATNVALDVLKAGGSAVDAAIAANAALGFLEPTGNGIGGDVFALVWDPKTQRLYGLNGSGRSAMGLSLADMRRRVGAAGQIPTHGPLTVTVPGAVDGWAMLHARFGALPWADVLAPAAALAERGAPVPPYIASLWENNRRRFEERFASGMLTEIANFRSVYLPAGRAPRAGEVFANPALAATYRAIAAGGRDAFYAGPMTQAMAGYLARVGSALTQADFAAHRGEWVEPLTIRYRGHDVWQLPPNGQGAATLQMLKILEGFDIKGLGLMNPESLHLQIEAKRLAFEDRARYFADPAFVAAPIAGLLDERYLARRRALIDPARPMPAVAAGDPAALTQSDTTYLAVADRNGMMVSLIQSNYRGMGSGLAPDGLGFMFQNRGEAFSLTDGHANLYAPGKRPFHTIIPGFMTRDGAPLLAFGVMGGDMQPQGQAQIVMNVVDHGLDVQAAGDLPRWRHEGGCTPEGRCTPGLGEVFVESGVPATARAGLAARGWTLRPGDGGFGGYQAIWRDPKTGVYQAATEMRTDGLAAGY